MKRRILFVIILMFFSCLTSCLFDYEIPESGTWQCEELDAEIYFNPFGGFIGKINIDGEIRLAEVGIGPQSLFDFYTLDDEGASFKLFSGNYRLKGDILYVTDSEDKKRYEFVEIQNNMDINNPDYYNKYPDSGLWRCETLNMEIDFNSPYSETSDCFQANVFVDGKSVELVVCLDVVTIYFPSIVSPEVPHTPEVDNFWGIYKFKNDVIYVTDSKDNTIHEFIEVI